MLFTVVTAVVDLVEADTAAEAMAAHQEILRRQGHEVFPGGCDAFVSEPTGPQPATART